MSENRKSYLLRDEENASVRISEELIPVIAALAATEVDGVSSLPGNITHDSVRKISARTLSQGLKSDVKDGVVRFDIALHIGFDRNIMDVTKEVQERVKAAVETMTGLTVEEVRVRVAGVDIQEEIL